MANKEQLRKVANRCSQYHFVGRDSMSFESNVLGETVRSCENCTHFTKERKCDINLVDEILSNMAELDYE
ncbi:hypothetical protein [Caldisalinibacter kiritimatiensis]|uniref:Uncharacterized protein n=1 Tax=Caldisalinibacter kiritimatiensis TaxID=1304284 RepID=R1CCP9_9FIRM|nr:hypothetical protein [Caldisalinibacter kiritimatiensis]EOD00060.1 hypothetical protein L21TH_1900 [Caldisalinibacter kiritimatiensis]